MKYHNGSWGMRHDYGKFNCRNTVLGNSQEQLQNILRERTRTLASSQRQRGTGVGRHIPSLTLPLKCVSFGSQFHAWHLGLLNQEAATTKTRIFNPAALSSPPCQYREGIITIMTSSLNPSDPPQKRRKLPLFTGFSLLQLLWTA